jgi:hypothetical protein
MKWLYFPLPNDIKDDPTMPANKKRYEDKYNKWFEERKLEVVQYPGSLDKVQIEDTLIVAGHGLPGNENIGLSVDNPNTPMQERIERFVGRHRPNTMQVTLQANDLADRISQAGLKKEHKYIKLITCGGAGMAVADMNSIVLKQGVEKGKETIGDVVSISLASVNTANCLASVLAIAMAQQPRGFTQLLVRGYPGFVNATHLQKFLTLETTSGQGSPGVAKDTYTKTEHTYWPNPMLTFSIGAIKNTDGQKARFWFDKTGQQVPGPD